jgi:hypothetical protein
MWHALLIPFFGTQRILRVVEIEQGGPLLLILIYLRWFCRVSRLGMDGVCIFGA